MIRDKVIEFSIDACRKARANEWEVYCIENERFVAEAKEGELEAMEASVGHGVAIRVRVEGRPGLSYSADLTKEALERAAQAAVSGARAADIDPDGAFAPMDGEVPDIELWDDDFLRADQSEKIARAIGIEEAARSFDKRVKNVRKAAYVENMRHVRIVNHLGLDRSARANICSASITAVAGEGEESQSGWDVAHSAKWARLDFEAVGRRAAKDAVELLGARAVPTQKAPVVLRNTAACDVLEVLGESFSGEAVAKGRSMLAGKTGQKVFSDIITVIDNGLIEGGAATFPFDGEGTPRKINTVVEEGVLRSFLYDLKWARKTGNRSTGNAGRGGYTDAPRPAKTNLYIQPGKASLEEMVSDMGSGLLVAELMGAHTANPVTGDFSVGAHGWWIEKGEKAYPVQGVTIAGNIIELLARINVVGADLRFVGQVGSPSLCVPSLDISGS